jgi:hypothetical protein
MFVLRFCSKNHQKLASTKGWVVEAEKGLGVRHKDVCHLLKAWNNISKGQASVASCTPVLSTSSSACLLAPRFGYTLYSRCADSDMFLSVLASTFCATAPS